MIIKDLKMEIPFPEWEDQTVYTLAGPEIGGLKHRMMLTIDRELPHNDIERFARTMMDRVLKDVQGAEILKNQQTTVEGGHPSYDFVVKWTADKDHLQSFRKYVFIIYDNRGFSFHIDFVRESYQLLNKQVMQLIESFLPGTYVVKKQEPEYVYHSPY